MRGMRAVLAEREHTELGCFRCASQKPESMAVAPIRAGAISHKRGTISHKISHETGKKRAGLLGCTTHLGVLFDARIDLTHVVCLCSEDHPSGLVDRRGSGSAGAG